MVGTAPTTLSVDCGGSGIKAAVLDAAGAMATGRVRVPTPYPLDPGRFVGVVAGLAGRLPAAGRVTVGLPGMVRHGRVVVTPHYVTVAGPHTPVDPGLQAAWAGFDVAAAVGARLGLPALALNDAELAGAALVAGRGLEVVLTLGTGLGCAVFDDARLAPHLEMSHATIRRGTTVDGWIGDHVRREAGRRRWVRRVVAVVDALRPVFVWDAVHLTGGNVRFLPADAFAGADEVAVHRRHAGIEGGARAWDLAGP